MGCVFDRCIAYSICIAYSVFIRFHLGTYNLLMSSFLLFYGTSWGQLVNPSPRELLDAGIA
jgi:hypothetical protein